MPVLCLLTAAVVSAYAMYWLDAPSAGVIRDTADLVEVNHFYCENGKLVFEQVIFWDWSDDDCRFHVVAWRLLKTPGQFPFRDRLGGGYLCIWIDGDWLRHVRAVAFRETWTQVDPELVDRERYPRENRRELGRPPVPAVTSGVPEPP